MRGWIVAAMLAVPCVAWGNSPFTIRVSAPSQVGQVAMLYAYMDLFTLRTVRLHQTLVDGQGHALLTGSTEGTLRVQLRVGNAMADLYVRPGSDLHVEWLGPDPRTPRSLNKPAQARITFLDMDPLDINALTSDLNARLDDLLLEDLATDAVAGMQALEVKRREGAPRDSSSRPPTLFVTPDMSTARLDSFELKLRRFYAGIEDPWFFAYLDHGMAGLRHGPRSNDLELYERYLKGRPVRYDDPEYVRCIRGLFEEVLITFGLRSHAATVQQAMANGRMEQLDSVMARHDMLRDDARFRELVILDQLYQHHRNKAFPAGGPLALLRWASVGSAYPEHRAIATNMVWDLTAMATGSPLPSMRLEDLQGKPVDASILMEGPLCLAFTASWCTYCAQEIAALQHLQKQYGTMIPIVVVGIDQDLASLRDHARKGEGRELRWLHAVAEQELREELRLRTLPAFLLVQDGVLVRSPAPLPSAGLGEIFHRAKVEAEREGRIKVWDD